MTKNKTLDLPQRQEKPREKGITAITDVGIPLGELVHILQSYHSLIDIAKLGIGTAYTEPLIDKLLKTIDKNRLIFEAPTPKSQGQLINQFGANVNLGNIFARDLLVLETQRIGLREETFFIS